MPTVTLALRSQRGKPVPDRVEFIEVRGRFSGPLHRDSIELRPPEVILDAVPDQYTVTIDVPGFASITRKLDVKFDPIARTFRLESLATRLPKVSELLPEQRRLLQSLDLNSTPGQIWDALSDNKAATFFQVTFALASVPLVGTGAMLSSAVDRVLYLGGSELEAPDPGGVIRRVIGWRMHVVFAGGSDIQAALEASGFKRDPGDAHPTHSRFGYKRSFREKSGSPKLQIVTDHGGAGADIDLDVGAFHNRPRTGSIRSSLSDFRTARRSTRSSSGSPRVTACIRSQVPGRAWGTNGGQFLLSISVLPWRDGAKKVPRQRCVRIVHPPQKQPALTGLIEPQCGDASPLRQVRGGAAEHDIVAATAVTGDLTPIQSPHPPWQ